TVDAHRGGRDRVAGVVVATAPEHDADRRVLDVWDVLAVGLEHRIGDAPRPGHGVAGAHDLLLRREHAPGGFELVAVGGHVGEHLRGIAGERVDGDVHAAPVGEPFEAV